MSSTVIRSNVFSASRLWKAWKSICRVRRTRGSSFCASNVTASIYYLTKETSIVVLTTVVGLTTDDDHCKRFFKHEHVQKFDSRTSPQSPHSLGRLRTGGTHG